MRPLQTNWSFRTVKRTDLLARKEIVMVVVGPSFDPTVDPTLQGILIRPDRNSIQRGYVHYHQIDPLSSREHKVELTTALGRNSRSSLRFWIRC